MSRETAIKKAKKYILRSCGKGKSCACEKAKKVFAAEALEIQAGAVSMFMDADDNDSEHPNKLPFRGVLLIVDVASTKPPHGSRGHRIYVPKRVVEEKLDGLIGMGVNYDRGDLDSHQTRHKVGIITKAWIKGNQVWVKGFAYKKDFPEVTQDLKRGGLGMSMELANVYVRDENEDVWHLEDFAFTGATILKKSAAAYFQTELVANSMKRVRHPALAASAAVASGKRKGDGMEKQKEKKTVAAASDTGQGQGALLVSAIEGAISKSMAPMVAELQASNERTNQLSNDLEELKGLYLIQAAAHEDDDEEEMEAAKEEDDDEEMEAAKDNKKDEGDEDGDEDDLEAMEDLEKEAAEEDPGELNKDAKNQGDKTSVENKVGQREKVSGNIAKGRLKSSGLKAWGKKPFAGLKSSTAVHAAASEIASLYAQVSREKKAKRELANKLDLQAAAHKKEMKKLTGKVDALEAQAERWADQVNRRSVIPVDIRNLAGKAGVDINELKASGQKLTVGDVDRMFAVAREQGISVDTLERARIKTRMHQLDLMDGGEQPFGQIIN